ncbi:MAG: MFS transporter [Lautropia sp.]|nr:MFS transporter [Lautropia sp.]
MSGTELRASLWLASLYAVRMLGLFLVMPVFALHAAGMPGGDDVFWVGFAFGVYGLTQAIFQIPFGAASDRFGRKPVITVGLLVMCAGSIVAAMADTVMMLAVGRALQGAGAVSAAISALVADSTRDVNRSKAMALIGVMIALSYAASLVIGPVLYERFALSGLFVLTGGLALLAIGVLWWLVPTSGPGSHPDGHPSDRLHPDEKPPRTTPQPGFQSPSRPLSRTRDESRAQARASADERTGRRAVRGPCFTDVMTSDLWRLNFGILVLHLTQMALFIVLPARLVAAGLPAGQHWQLYLPVVAVAFLLILGPMRAAERKGRMRPVFLAAVLLVMLAQLGFAWPSQSMAWLTTLLVIFFIGFNLLEALLPSLVSRLVPAGGRGLALGFYSTSQSLGVFAGGAVGGLLARHLGDLGVALVSALLMLIWWLVARSARRWPSSVKPAD